MKKITLGILLFLLILMVYTFAATCGNGVCETGENATNCAADCTNQTIEILCTYASCDDNNSCTIDDCNIRCSHKLILWCRDGDGCCPSKCTAEDDDDCLASDECINDSDCDDDDISTLDICLGIPKKCNNTEIIDCVTGDDYCPLNCTYEEDKDCPEPDQCSTDSECDDGNVCTEDACEGAPKKCLSKRISSGCSVDDSCVPIGTKTTTQYCSTENELKNQKDVDMDCDNNYECKTDLCSDGKCTKLGFFRRIIGWFKGLFS